MTPADLVDTLFGHGTDLDALQMSMRALTLFVITLGLLRVAGMRTFGGRTPFDTTVAIMLGAVLSRAVVGASPYVPTVAAAAVLVVVHRLVAMLGAHSPTAARVLNGDPRRLYRRGATDEAAMKRGGISHRDLVAAAREKAQRGDLDGVDEIWLEEDGELSVVTERAARSAPASDARTRRTPPAPAARS